MDWLEKHLRNFVIPHIGLKFLGSKSPFTGELRPAAECEFPQTGMLKAYLKSTGKWDYLHHVTKGAFKKLRLQEIVEQYQTLHRKIYHRRFTDEEIIHTLVKNSIKDLKHELKHTSNKVFLLGRDVWLWAIMAERMGLPYYYEPSVSRNVAVRKDVMRNLLLNAGVQEGDVIFDTGFAGSIYKGCETSLGTHDFRRYDRTKVYQLKNMMLSADDRRAMQFAHHGPARNRALFIEYLPKYFETGFVQDDKPYQSYASFDEFVRAALVTIWAWNFNSPSWISGPPTIRRSS